MRNGPLTRLIDLDERLYRAATARPAQLVDNIVYPLTRSADGGVLWLTIAALLAGSGNPTARRAAIRATASLTLTSIVANLVVKPIFRRPRPNPIRHSWQSRAFKTPRTTSFPSGHSACAAAFAVGATAETPLAAPLIILAAAVAYSRVRTRVHYPLDVAAGCAIGTTIALAMAVYGPTSGGGDHDGARSKDPFPSQGATCSSRSGSELDTPSF